MAEETNMAVMKDTAEEMNTAGGSAEVKNTAEKIDTAGEKDTMEVKNTGGHTAELKRTLEASDAAMVKSMGAVVANDAVG
ncbi:hypothetical protein PF005_g31110 [Phytophthora fragariae]|uniref:Uncharacterized protein n=1 Tax=Phytophthora fragariae TaxID=53985 RepID=A0A6A3VAH0_9STRA|nr:hypothetical protein PF005_g31110 [Phytophthora fragariae]